MSLLYRCYLPNWAYIDPFVPVKNSLTDIIADYARCSEYPWHSHLLPNIWQWSCHYLFLRHRFFAAGIRTPNLPLAGRTLSLLRHRCGPCLGYLKKCNLLQNMNRYLFFFRKIPVRIICYLRVQLNNQSSSVSSTCITQQILAHLKDLKPNTLFIHFASVKAFNYETRIQTLCLLLLKQNGKRSPDVLLWTILLYLFSGISEDNPEGLVLQSGYKNCRDKYISFF